MRARARRAGSAGEDARRAELLPGARRRAAAVRRARRARRSRPPLALARSRGDAELLARAALGFSGLGVTIIAVDDEAVALLEEALDAVPTDHPLRARLLARLAIETYYACTPAQRKALGDEAVALARPRAARR